MLEIKRIGPESSKLLSDLCVNTFLQAYKGVHSQENIESYCRKNYSERNMQVVLSQVDTLAKVAYSKSQPSGFYVVKHHACPVDLGVQASELKQIYVLSGYYGTGLGKNYSMMWLNKPLVTTVSGCGYVSQILTTRHELSTKS